MPPIIDLRHTLGGLGREPGGQHRVHSGMCDHPLAAHSRGLRPPSCPERGQRCAGVAVRVGEHAHLVVAGEHDIDRGGRQARRREVRGRARAPIEQITHLDDPTIPAAPSALIEHANRSEQRAQRVAARVHIPDHDLDHGA
jgi:hypothetical protein